MQWNDEIIGLWPTPILRSQSADESLLSQLGQLAVNGASNRDDNLFASENAAVASVRETISSAVQAYFKHLEVGTVPAWTLRGRIEKLAYGETQPLRHAPDAHLSGLFYIQAPKDKEALHLRADTHPGCLSLFDPRPGFNMCSIKNDPYRNQSLMVEPQPGLFLMWPASVNSYRHPNLSRTPQLCICFDVILAGGEVAEMSPAPPWAGDLHEMWPTGLIKRRLRDHHRPNQDLIAIIDDMERQNRDLTTDFNTNRFGDSRHPAVNWLMGEINRSLTLYFKQMGMHYPISWGLASWPNVNRFGDYHSPHNHPWCYLSGTYYIQVPEPDETPEAESPSKPGCISFYDPRSQTNADIFPAGSRANPVFTVKPVAGALLIWPSPVYHFVHPNLSTRKRYSISFNVHLQWQDHYS